MQALKKQERPTLATQNIPEVETINLRRSFLAETSLILLLLILILVFIPLTLEFPSSVQILELNFSEYFVINIPIPFFMLMPLMLGMFLLHKHYNSKYSIASDHVRTLDGIISLKLNDKRIDYVHVRGVEIESSLGQRIFDIGNIVIGSAMQSEEGGLILSGIRHPQHYRNIIEERIRSLGSSDD